MEDFRNKGLLGLNMVLKNKNNIDILEKNIYEISKNNSSDYDDDIKRIYLYSIYQIINDNVLCLKCLGIETAFFFFFIEHVYFIFKHTARWQGEGFLNFTFCP